MSSYTLSHIKELEAESIFILREAHASFEKPVLLYSIGKDSSVMLRLARKAFSPGKVPFPAMHVDTTMKFPEMISCREEFTKREGVELTIYRSASAVEGGVNPFSHGTKACCSLLKTQALLCAIRENGFDGVIGGARREEERSRAKERIFSFRDENGTWDPRGQRPELWHLFNSRIKRGESVRVFPLSNWTEIDIWHYIHLEGIPVVPLYFAKQRKVVRRGGQFFLFDAGLSAKEGEVPEDLMCRFRTLGCLPCTGALPSQATTVPEIIEELLRMRVSERAGRIIDFDEEGSMEVKKGEGYF